MPSRSFQIFTTVPHHGYWKETKLYCVACGQKSVWRESNPDTAYGCTSCGEVFFMTTPDYNDDPLHVSIKELQGRLKTSA